MNKKKGSKILDTAVVWIISKSKAKKNKIEDLCRESATHEKNTRFKNRISWQNYIIGCLSLLRLKTSDIFRKAIHTVIRFARDYYKPRFDSEQVSDSKSTLNLFGNEIKSHRTAGDFY